MSYIKVTEGYCPVCENETKFIAAKKWLRDHYRCHKCGSLPRERALHHVMNNLFPNWTKSVIHESSPVRVYPPKVMLYYSASNYYPDRPLGAAVGHFVNENIESLTFENESFNFLLSLDVLEHVFNPWEALKETYRVLKPGGAHVFTTPKHQLPFSQKRAELNEDGSVVHLLPAVFHGNPISTQGSLVTWDFGQDFEDLIKKFCGLDCVTINQCVPSRGIEGEYLDVFVVTKKMSQLQENSYSRD